jgi:dolichol-phosphate mannosyltransferase
MSRRGRSWRKIVTGEGKHSEGRMTEFLGSRSVEFGQQESTLESARDSISAFGALSRPTVWIVLPAYNEEKSLPPLLENIAQAMFDAGLEYRVLIIDDGSRDATADVIRTYAQRMHIQMERHKLNMGLGATIRDGLLRAAELCSQRDILVTMDADNSHSPALIVRMVAMIAEGHDVVIASRYQHGSVTRGVPPLRLLFSYGASILFRMIFPISGVRDYTCGFRAYRATVMKRVAKQYGPAFFDQQGFQCMVDILLKLRRQDLIFGEVPMILRYDRKEGASKMRVGRTIADTFRLMLKRRLSR